PLLLEKIANEEQWWPVQQRGGCDKLPCQWSERQAVFRRRGQPAATLGNAPMLAVFVANRKPGQGHPGSPKLGFQKFDWRDANPPAAGAPSPRVSRGNPARIKFRCAKKRFKIKNPEGPRI